MNFIEGIEVLNEIIEITKTISPYMRLFLFAGVIAAMWSVTFFICDYLKRVRRYLGIICIICMMAAIICATFPQKTETKLYEVTISDQVKFTDFNSRYEVVKQEGKIYTIKMKE